MRHTRPAPILSLLLIAATSFGCAFGEVRWDDPLQREISLEDAQQRYTVLVRWSHFEEAADFVDPELKNAYIASFPSFKELRFTEYEQEPLEIDEELATATVRVTYSAYLPTSPIETQVHETQVWYRDKGVANNWRVRPSFEGIDVLLPPVSGNR